MSDKKVPEDMRKGVVHTTNKSGKLEILDYKSAMCVLVRFPETGYSCSAMSSSIRSGNVKDYIAPIKCGVGYIGVGSYSQTNHRKAYSIWNAMIYRCYDKRTQDRQPTYKGCSVSIEWHNFQSFAEWFFLNHKDGLHLDKDVKVNGNKIYSKDTCSFVTRKENNSKAKAVEFSFKSPAGVVFTGVNVSDFCRDNNLSSAHMCNVAKGNRISHKGWTKG